LEVDEALVAVGVAVVVAGAEVVVVVVEVVESVSLLLSDAADASSDVSASSASSSVEASSASFSFEAADASVDSEPVVEVAVAELPVAVVVVGFAVVVVGAVVVVVGIVVADELVAVEPDDVELVDVVVATDPVADASTLLLYEPVSGAQLVYTCHGSEWSASQIEVSMDAPRT
jgi:hypothetical protein